MVNESLEILMSDVDKPEPETITNWNVGRQDPKNFDEENLELTQGLGPIKSPRLMGSGAKIGGKGMIIVATAMASGKGEVVVVREVIEEVVVAVAKIRVEGARDWAPLLE